MADDKKPLSDASKIGIGIALIVLIVGVYSLGRYIGYNKGFDKGVGWQ